MQRLKLFIPLIVFAVLAVFFFIVQKQIGSGAYDPQGMPSALLDKPMPAFQLPDLLTGAPVTNDVMRDKVVLVNVWATWCPSCLYEHAYLVKLAQQGIAIVGVDYKDKPDKARQWIAEKGNPYVAVLDDGEGKLGLDLGVTGAPETYLVDRRGVVRWRYMGPLDDRVWNESLQPLLAKIAAEQGG